MISAPCLRKSLQRVRIELLFALVVLLVSGTGLKAQVRSKTVDISEQKIVIPDFDYYVEDVIVAQKEKELLGFTMYTKMHLRFFDPIEATLKSYFTHQLPHAANKKPLIIRVNKISMIGHAEYSWTNLSVSLITFTDSGYLQLFNGSADTAFSWTDIFDTKTPQRRGENLIDAFEHCFYEFQRRARLNNLRSRKISPGDIRKVPSDSSWFAISGNPKPVKGVIRSHSEFLDHRIDTTVSFYTRPRKPSDTNRFQVKFPRGLSSEIWGFCDGKNYYYELAGDYYLIVFNKNTTTIGFYIDRKNTRSSLGLREGIGEFRGYSSVHLAETSTVSSTEMGIDLLTGRLIQSPVGHEIIFDCYNKKSTEEICIYEEGQNLGCLRKGEFLRYKYHPSAGISRLELKSGSKTREIRFDPWTTQRIVILNKEDKIITRYMGRMGKPALEKYLRKGRTEIVQGM